MLAARAYPDETHFRLEDVPVPQIGPRDVLIKVHSSGLARGTLALWRQRGRIKLLPATLGNEAAGEIVEVGADAFGVAVGQRVRMHAPIECGPPHLRATFLIGHAIYNDAAMSLYAQYHDGGLAEYVKVPFENVDLIPEGVSYEHAAKVHVVAVAWRTVKEIGAGIGDTIVVTGATGATGAGAIAAAPILGITRVIAVSRARKSLESVVALNPGLVVPLALEELGEDWRTTGGLTKALRDLAGPGGIAGVADFLPTEGPATVQSIMAMRSGGRAILSGGNRETISLVYGDMRVRDLAIGSSNGFERRDALDILAMMAAGRYDAAPMITHRRGLAQINEAVDDIDERRGNPMLVAIEVA
jgi:threonine dehydrogenase-like Zn-dependent dehydrogenase